MGNNINAIPKTPPCAETHHMTSSKLVQHCGLGAFPNPEYKVILCLLTNRKHCDLCHVFAQTTQSPTLSQSHLDPRI